MISLVIADDHELVRTAIKLLLSNVPGIRVTGEASSGEQAIQLVKENKPDVLLLDIGLPGISGIETANRLLRNDSKTKIIVLSAYEHEPLLSAILKMGVKGYLTKGASSEEMIKAIRSVSIDQTYLEPKLAQQVALTSISPASVSPIDTLSPRELEIMFNLVKGERTLEIARKLCLSHKTVHTYRHRIFEKLSVKTDVELTLLAVRQGWLTLSSKGS